jgi:hypothetical protein
MPDARLLLPAGCDRPFMPSFLVQRKPSAPGQYQAGPTDTVPSPLTPYPLPHSLSNLHPLAGWPRFVQPVTCFHNPGVPAWLEPRSEETMVGPSCEIAMELLLGSPGPRSTNRHWASSDRSRHRNWQPSPCRRGKGRSLPRYSESDLSAFEMWRSEPKPIRKQPKALQQNCSC